MNTQQAFDTITNHLYTQKVRATHDNGCSYRGNNGTMCAVGCVLPDEFYVSEMDSCFDADKKYPGIEGVGIIDIARYFNLPGWMYVNLEFLTEMQRFHDNAELGFSVDNPSQMSKLSLIAYDFGLKFDVEAFKKKFS